MLKNKGIILLAVILLLTLGIGNIVLAEEIHEEPGQDLNNTWSNKPSTISDGDNDKEDVSNLEEAKFSLRLTIGKNKAKVGEEEVALDVAPFIENERTMVPLRFIGEQLGAEISWSQAERKVGYKLGDKAVELWIDKNIASVNGIEMLIDENPLIVPIIRNDRTFVPVRFIVEALGFEIEWNGETKEVMVQDYNSSRSNKPRPISDVRLGEDEDKDEEPGKAEAQDYNSSRSNKPSPIMDVSLGGDEDKEEEPGKAEAQDYNSSRSNKPSPIMDVDNDDKFTGFNINWDQTENKAIYKLKDNTIEIWLDKDLVLLNGMKLEIDSKKPMVILNKDNDLLLGPIHFMSKVSGYTLEWNPETKQLTIIKD